MKNKLIQPKMMLKIVFNRTKIKTKKLLKIKKTNKKTKRKRLLIEIPFHQTSNQNK